MIVLDAGVLIGFLDGRDPHHEPSIEILGRPETSFVVHSLTLAEALVGPSRVGRAEEAWRDLQTVGVTIADNTIGWVVDREPVALARLRSEHGLKMPDICVLAIAEHIGAPLATFDQRLAAVAEGLGLLLPTAG